jgi:hypothetical protein
MSVPSPPLHLIEVSGWNAACDAYDGIRARIFAEKLNQTSAGVPCRTNNYNSHHQPPASSSRFRHAHLLGLGPPKCHASMHVRRMPRGSAARARDMFGFRFFMFVEGDGAAQWHWAGAMPIEEFASTVTHLSESN